MNEKKAVGSKTNPKKKLLDKPWFIVLMSIVLAPFGIYLIWTRTQLKNSTKVVFSIMAGIWFILMIVNAFSTNHKSFELDGQQVSIHCSSNSDCDKIAQRGGEDAFRILYRLGIRDITIQSLDVHKKEITIKVINDAEDTAELVLSYRNGHTLKISSKTYPNLLLYSSDGEALIEDLTLAGLKAAETAEQERLSQDEAERKRQEELAAQAKAAENARYPSSSSAISLCEEAFHRQYPYSKSKVHSILGVIASERYQDNKYLYKAEVDIQNAFGAVYETVMECVVRREGDLIKIDSFYIY